MPAEGAVSRAGSKRAGLSAARARLEALSRVMNVGLLVLDRDGRIDFASPAALELFDCADPEALSRRCGDLTKSLVPVDPAQRRPLRRVVEVAGRDGVRSLRLEIHALEVECPGWLVLVKDRRSMDMLETDLVLASQMRSLVHVYRVMAHDLKAPLNSMQLTLELLADSLAEEDPFGTPAGARDRRQRHVSILREELARLNRALQSMLDQGEPLGSVPHAFDLRELAREVTRLLTPQARRQRVELDLRLPDAEVRVTGHRDRIKQALVNLALSALEGMAGGGRLAIRLGRDDRVQLSFQDSGTGVPEGLLDEVYQTHFTREKSRAGTRLYVARLVVESHGGELVVESDPGRGTRYLVILPAAGLAETAASTPAAPAPQR